MIVGLLIDLLVTVLGWLIGIRGDWHMDLPPVVTTLIKAVMYFDTFLPIHETLACVALAATLFSSAHIVKWSVKLVDWFDGLLP